MTGKVMDGRPVAKQVREKVREEVSVLRLEGLEPTLATVLVGNNPASKTYLKNKHAACADVGIRSRNIELEMGTSQSQLETTIRGLNQDPEVNGILLQLPLPRGLTDASAINEISALKDVDGLHPFNLGQLSQKNSKLVPCTPKGIVVLLKYYAVNIAGSNAVIINRSKLVGRPLSQLLLNEDATVTVCHSKTQQLNEVANRADILVTGIGHRREFTVDDSMVKPGAVVVDVGSSEIDGKMRGDVDFDSVLEMASYVTPVPGGVGPMTIAMLLYNTLVATSLQRGFNVGFDPYELISPAP